MNIFDLSGLSTQQLRELSKRATALANDLEKMEPSYSIALEHGIIDRGYKTTANGYVNSYRGECEFTMSDGRRWKAVGHSPDGDAWSIYRNGYIEFIPLSSAASQGERSDGE